MHKLHLAILAITLSLPAASQSITTVARVGDPVPGAGVITAFRDVSLAPYGDWFAHVQTSDPLVGSAVLYPGGVEALAGETVWNPAGASIAEFGRAERGFLTGPTWVLKLAGTAGGSADDEVLACWKSVNLVEGQPTSFYTGDFATGSTWHSFHGSTRGSASGAYLFHGRVNDPTWPAGPRGFIALGGYGGSFCVMTPMSVLAFEGQVLTGLGETITKLRDGYDSARFDNRYQDPIALVAYAAALGSDPSKDGCVLTHVPASGVTVIVAREGSPSPVPGRLWGDLEDAQVEVGEQGASWALRASLDASDPASDQVLVQDGQVVVQEGSSHPDIGAFVFDDLGSGPPQMDRNGRVLWYGHWNDASPGATPEGLFLDQQLIVRAGWSTVGGVPIRRLDSAPGSLHIAADGKNIVFTGELEDGTVGAFVMELGVDGAPCQAKLNSAGCTTHLSWTGGWASASGASPFVVQAAPALGQVSGLFFYGVDGQALTSFAGGILCVTPPFARTQVLSTGGGGPPATSCDGSLEFDFGAWVQSGADPLLVPGVRVWTQAWFRDPGFAAPNDVGLSDALTFRVQP